MALETAPVAVKAALVVAGGQALAVTVLAFMGLLASSDRSVSLPLFIFFLMVAASLLAGIFALAKKRPFGRSLVLVWQLFALIIGVQSALSGFLIYGLVMAVTGGFTLLLLFSRSTLDYLASGPENPTAGRA